MTTPPPPGHGQERPGDGSPQQPEGGQGQAYREGIPRNSVSLPTQLSALPVTAWQWVGGFIAVFLVVTVAITALSGVMAAALDIDGELQPGDNEVSIVRIAAFFLTYAWTSHIGFESEPSDFVGGGGITSPVSIFALAGLAAIGFATRWLTRRFPPSSRLAMWGQLGGAVVGCLVVVGILGLIGSISDDEGTVSPLGFGAMTRLAFLLTLTGIVGLALAAPKGQRAHAIFGVKVGGIIRQSWPSIDATLVHLCAWSLLGLIGGLFAVVAIREDVSPALSVSYLTTAIPAAVTWAHLGGIGLSVEGEQDLADFIPSDLVENTAWTIFSEQSPWILWLLPLLAGGVVAIIATRLTLIREPGSSIAFGQILVTSSSLVVAWFVIARVAGSLSVGFEGAAYGDEFGGHFGAGPTWWTYLLLFLTGVAIELVHAFVGVTLVQSLPRTFVQRVAPRPHPSWNPYLGPLPAAAAGAGEQAGAQPMPGAPDSERRQAVDHNLTDVPAEEQPTTQTRAAGLAADEQTTAANPAAEQGWSLHESGDGAAAGAWGQPQPMSRRAKAITGAVLGMVVLALLAWVVLDQIGKRYFGPEGVALDYASAVVDGRAADAVEIGRANVADRHRVLLTDAVYGSAEGRPDAAEVVDVVEDEEGESATVTVEFEQEGQRFTQELVAEQAGRRMLLFDEWRLQPVELKEASVTVLADSFTVNGETVDIGEAARPDDPHIAPMGTDSGVIPGYELSVPALPGRYEVEIPKSKYTRSETSTIHVTGGSEEDDGAFGEGPTLAAQPNEAFVEEVNSQIKKKIDTCIASYEEDTCPWDSQYSDDTDYKWVSFSVDGYPSYSKDDDETEPLREGEGISLDFEDTPEITEEATCTDDVFFCDEGETTDSTTYMDSTGWTAMYTDGEVKVEWSDDF